MAVTQNLLEEVIKEIVDRFHPEKIILFGSYAYGEPQEDSDVDILIIMNTNLRPVEQAVEIRRQADFPFPVDLLVRTPEQVLERVELGDPFFKEILSRGKVYYEAHNEGVDRESRRKNVFY